MSLTPPPPRRGMSAQKTPCWTEGPGIPPTSPQHFPFIPWSLRNVLTCLLNLRLSHFNIHETRVTVLRAGGHSCHVCGKQTAGMATGAGRQSSSPPFFGGKGTRHTLSTPFTRGQATPNKQLCAFQVTGRVSRRSTHSRPRHSGNQVAFQTGFLQSCYQNGEDAPKAPGHSV